MQIEFLGEKVIGIKANETILQASLGGGIPHFHSCGGNAKCSTCRILVVNGGASLTPPNEKERLLNSQMHFPPNVRLACQTSVTNRNVKVRRIIQDETDIGLYISNHTRESKLNLGEERELALFFLDIRNFTCFVEQHPAFDVIHIIQKLFAVFQKIVEGNEGRIVETTGDGFYAVFGYEEKDRRKSARHAVQTAKLILAKLDQLNRNYFPVYFNEIIQIGIGIHIGRVVSGTIRIADQIHSIVMGFPVNIASRLQDATKELNNDLVISAEICDLLAEVPAVEPKIILVKGVSTPLTVFLLGAPYVHNLQEQNAKHVDT
jgi:adenylate cyclase